MDGVHGMGGMLGFDAVRVEATDPPFASRLAGALVGPRQASGDAVPARFAVGDLVTVKGMATADHHRRPRYVWGATGTVTATPGGWPHASGDGPAALDRLIAADDVGEGAMVP